VAAVQGFAEIYKIIEQGESGAMTEGLVAVGRYRTVRGR
jgi:hypothetical protein